MSNINSQNPGQPSPDDKPAQSSSQKTLPSLNHRTTSPKTLPHRTIYNNISAHLISEALLKKLFLLLVKKAVSLKPNTITVVKKKLQNPKYSRTFYETIS